MRSIDRSIEPDGERVPYLIPQQNGDAEQETPDPLFERQCHAREGERAVLHEHDLKNESDDPDAVEDRIGEQSSEDVLLSVDLAAVDFVEQGHEHEDVEDHREVLRWLEDVVHRSAVVHVEDGRPEKQHEEHHGELVDGVTDDVLHHVSRDQRSCSPVRFTREQFFCGHFRGQCQRGQRVHDEIDPEHLHGTQRRLLDDARADERAEHGDDVDRQLKLKELRDRIVDVSAPHHCLDDGVEVVVDENDVRCFLGHVRTLDALFREIDMLRIHPSIGEY